MRVSCLLEVYIIFLFITVTFVIIWKFHLFYFILFIFWLSNMTKKKIIFTNFGTTTFKITISTYLEKRFSCPSEISIKKSVCFICKLFAGMITPFLCDCADFADCDSPFSKCVLSFNEAVQSDLHKTTTHWTPQKWLSWAGGRLLKHLYKTTTNQMWSFLAGF